MRRRAQVGDSSRRGSALALSLVVVTLVAGLGFTFLSLAAAVTKRQASDVETVQAFYIAEAGLAEAFHAVRSGRSGQLGTAAEPATFGGGLLWVESVENRDGNIELDAQALFGRARSALRMTVEPVPVELGFFADEDLVIDSVLMVDGFEAEAGPAQPAAPPVGPLQVNILPPPPSHPAYSPTRVGEVMGALEETLTPEFTARLLSADNDLAFSVDLSAPLSQWLASYVDESGFHIEPCLIDVVQPVLLNGLNGGLEELRFAYPSRHLQSFDGTHHVYQGWNRADYRPIGNLFQGPEHDYLFDPDGNLRSSTEIVNAWLDARLEEAQTGLVTTLLGVDDSGSTEAQSLDPQLPDTVDGGSLDGVPLGLLGSNGNVSFQLSGDDGAVINGDVLPGPEGSVTGLGAEVQVTGSTDSRASEVDLPPVDVPSIPLEDGVSHSDLMPFTIPPGAVGYESLEIREDAELVLRGPATVVIGDLILEEGALMTLDTRNGAVDLYVTGSMDLAPGSDVSTTAELSSDTTIQVSASQTSGDPLVQLEATSSFTGTIYSPQADVLVGADFEVFGGIVARRLELAPGARLHAARGDTEGTPLPELVSWKMLVVPTAPNLAHPDPFRLYGMLRENVVPLAAAHDLDSIWIDVTLIDLAGNQREYNGLESGLDWSQVAEVLKVERRVDFEELKQAAKDARLAMGADARREEPALTDDGESDPLQQPGDIHPSIRLGVELGIANPTTMSKDDIKDAMAPYVPITSGEARYIASQAPDFCDHCLGELQNP